MLLVVLLMVLLMVLSGGNLSANVIEVFQLTLRPIIAMVVWGMFFKSFPGFFSFPHVIS